MEALFIIWLAVMGLVVGSFLNVVIARVPNGESIVHPRSKCPKCGHQLAWFENVPVVSWVVLRGKCRSCKAPISVRYVMVELLTGALFLAALTRFGWTWQLVAALTFIGLVVPLVFIDAETWLLPFELTLPGIALGIALKVPLGWPAMRDALIGAVAAFILFRVMEALGFVFTRREALGAGDKYLLAMICGFLGWQALLGVVLLASIQGAVFGIARILATGRAGPEVASSPAATVPETPVVADAPVTASTEALPESSTPAVTEGDEPEETFTFDFARPGLPFWRRLALIPWSLFIQPIPDDPPLPDGAEPDDEPEWVPGPSNLPFGPWLGLAALEVMLLSPFIAAHLDQHTLLAGMLRLVFPS